MPRSEYHEVKMLPGERSVPSIKVDAVEILELLCRAEMMMTAVDRRRFCSRAISAIEDVIRDFVVAHDFDDDREEYLKKMWADIAVFLTYIRIIGKRNCIRVRPEHETMTCDEMKLAIFNRVASLDEGATKWKKSIYRNKGKTPADGR